MVHTDILLLISPYREILGRNYVPYVHHVQRVVLLTLALKQKTTKKDLAKISIAAVFHDIGIWTHQTFDYLDPSIEEAKRYLRSTNQTEWIEEITLIISMHHKLSEYKGKFKTTVEPFRKADLIDLTKGVKRYGLSKKITRKHYTDFPARGFQKILITLWLKRLIRFPFNSLPMLKK